MTSVVKIPFMSSDFVVQGQDRDLDVFVSAYASTEFQALGTAVFNGGTIFERKELALSKSLDTRFSLDAFALNVRFDTFSSVGTLVLTAAVAARTTNAEDSVTLQVFPTAQATQTVSSSDDLKGALIAAKGFSGSHYRIKFNSGTYTFPSSDDSHLWDLTDATLKLISFEPVENANVFLKNSAPRIARSLFTNLTFITDAASGTAHAVVAGVKSVLVNCRFFGQTTGNSVGIRVSSGADARVEGGHFYSLKEGVVGASVVRGTFWDSISGIVFRNISRVLEGTSGYSVPAVESDSPDRCWLYYSPANYSPMIRHNMAMDIYPSAIRCNKNTQLLSAGVVGNVLLTFGDYGLELGSVTSSYVVHNSVQTKEASGSSIRFLNSQFDKNYVVNNYFTRLPSNVKSFLDGNTWDYNATSTTKNGGENSVTEVDPGFANKYLLLTRDSALLNRGLPQAGMLRAFGSLRYQGQIGAMPYHPDVSLTSVLAAVVSQPDYGATIKDSPEGDLVGPEPGGGAGGQLNFRDGSQSGWLAVV